MADEEYVDDENEYIDGDSEHDASSCLVVKNSASIQQQTGVIYDNNMGNTQSATLNRNRFTTNGYLRSSAV